MVIGAMGSKAEAAAGADSAFVLPERGMVLGYGHQQVASRAKCIALSPRCRILRTCTKQKLICFVVIFDVSRGRWGCGRDLGLVGTELQSKLAKSHGSYTMGRG